MYQKRNKSCGKKNLAVDSRPTLRELWRWYKISFNIYNATTSYPTCFLSSLFHKKNIRHTLYPKYLHLHGKKSLVSRNLIYSMTAWNTERVYTNAFIHTGRWQPYFVLFSFFEKFQWKNCCRASAKTKEKSKKLDDWMSRSISSNPSLISISSWSVGIYHWNLKTSYEHSIHIQKNYKNEKK